MLPAAADLVFRVEGWLAVSVTASERAITREVSSMSDILAVMSVALKATFWPCQQDFYHLSDRGYDRDKAPAYQASIKTSQASQKSRLA